MGDRGFSFILLCCVCVTLIDAYGAEAAELARISSIDLGRCGPVCMIYCPNGNVMDGRGCPTCKCNPEPKPVCPPVCAIHCRNGNVMDKNGQCLPECDRLCPMWHICPWGYATDSRGCSTCTCKPRPDPICRKVVCSKRCKTVIKNGCPTCECIRPPICPMVRCPAWRICPWGYETDANGCRTCQCKKRHPVDCRPVLCDIHCLGGFLKDRNGCEICACAKPRPCPRIMCALHCPAGYVKDGNGCKTCRCQPDWI